MIDVSVAHYIVDEQGNRRSVVLPIAEYERLVQAAEELADISDHDEAVAALKSGEERVPWEESKRRRRGL